MDEILSVYERDRADPSRAIVLAQVSGPSLFRVTVSSGRGTRTLWSLEIRPPRAPPPLVRTEFVEKT